MYSAQPTNFVVVPKALSLSMRVMSALSVVTLRIACSHLSRCLSSAAAGGPAAVGGAAGARPGGAAPGRAVGTIPYRRMGRLLFPSSGGGAAGAPAPPLYRAPPGGGGRPSPPGGGWFRGRPARRERP